MLKVFVIFIGFLSVFGCGSTEKIVGEYVSEGESMVQHKLSLKEDRTFEYRLNGELIDASSFGKWHLSDQKELVMNSSQSLQPGVIDCTENVDLSNELLDVTLMDEYGQPLPSASITLNGDHTIGFNVDDNGYGNYRITDVKSISISYLGNKYHYLITDQHANKFVLTVRLQNNASFFLNDESWKIRRKKIIGKNNLVLIRN